ncbi:hypothetical protein [Streptomyces sp. TP-A0356]|uniref:hypothetical protein n=1 Tax=Streptomyces sp. TP-A0356 TaxID=1359208 RepID=UPI0006E25F3E|nr:hypothetical protein [Streptomyces sp. TP-A0356]
MQPAAPRDVLTITAAAATGAVAAALWWAHHIPRPSPRSHDAARYRVEELHVAFRDASRPPVGEPEDVLRQHWSRLHPLRFAPPAGATTAAGSPPVAPTA